MTDDKLEVNLRGIASAMCIPTEARTFLCGPGAIDANIDAHCPVTVAICDKKQPNFCSAGCNVILAEVCTAQRGMQG
eukprot:3107811-Lingulodinium_polyedra.AAC.1